MANLKGLRANDAKTESGERGGGDSFYIISQERELSQLEGS